MVEITTIDWSGVAAYEGDSPDFPTAWAIQNEGGLEHDPRCSSVPGWHPLSGPAMLCDCGAVRKEWLRRCPAPAPGEEEKR